MLTGSRELYFLSGEKVCKEPPGTFRMVPGPSRRPKGERRERCQWREERPERVAAVDKIEDKRKPDDFIGNRNRTNPPLETPITAPKHSPFLLAKHPLCRILWVLSWRNKKVPSRQEPAVAFACKVAVTPSVKNHRFLPPLTQGRLIYRINLLIFLENSRRGSFWFCSFILSKMSSMILFHLAAVRPSFTG